MDDGLIDILSRTIQNSVTSFVYLPDWNFTKAQMHQVLNSCTDLETIDIRRNEARVLKNSDDIHVYLEDTENGFRKLKRLYLVSVELNQAEVKHITLAIINSTLIKRLEVINLNHNVNNYDYKQALRDAGYKRSFY